MSVMLKKLKLTTWILWEARAECIIKTVGHVSYVKKIKAYNMDSVGS